MSVPTPGSWIKPKTPIPTKELPVRKPFELRPHLTDKPFKNDPLLSELRDRFNQGMKNE